MTFVSAMEGKTGEEVFALGLLQGLCDMGKSKNLVVFSTEPMKKQLLKKYPELNVVSFKKTGKKFYTRKLNRYIKKNPLNIVYYPHVHKYLNTDLPCVTAATAHGMNSKEVSKKARRITFAKLRELDKIAAAGEMVKDEILAKHTHMSPSKVRVICNPLVDIRPE